MPRTFKLATLLMLGLGSTSIGAVYAFEDDAASDMGRPLVIGNRSEPTETQLLVLSKSFCVAMRRNHDREHTPELRSYFDPRYLEAHGLLEGDFQLKMAPVHSIHNIQVADDSRTVVCHVESDEGQQEVILLRVVAHEGALYVAPTNPPDAQTNLVQPWILRMSL